MLFTFKKVDSPLCDFCEKEVETKEHVLFYCTNVHIFWDNLTTFLNSLNITVSFDIKDVLLGILDTSNSVNILINYIALESNFFIYRCKLNKAL